MTSVVRSRETSLQRALDFPLGAGVERAGGFVQQQDRRVLEDGAGDGDALLFAAGKLQAALAHHGVIALRQLDDEFVDLGQPRRFLDLGIAGADPAIGDVVADRVVEQHRVLRNDADGGAQARLRDVADVLPVDGHRCLRLIS